MSAKSRTMAARQTRWLYRLEARAFQFNSEANGERSIHFLRKLAARIWKAEAPEGRRMPSIKAGRGVRHGNQWVSCCYGYTEIILARQHRNILVLLHELTHALGPCLHGPKFVKVYFPLLNKYASFNRWFLQGVAAERNILI